jgi:hypothetical protein
MRDLHSALKTTVLREIHEGGIRYKVVRLQNGKDDFVDSLIVPLSTVSILLNLPITVNEMVLAVWLIVKGLNSSAIASLSAKTE